MWLSWRKKRRIYVLIGLILASSVSYLSISRLNGAGNLNLQHEPRNSAGFMERLRSRQYEVKVNSELVSTVSLSANLPNRKSRLGPTSGEDSTLLKGSSTSSLNKGNVSEIETMELKESIHLDSGSECSQWVNLAPKPPYFLTVVLLVRIYEKDKAKLTTAEMKMWLQYLRYAGVEHVYIYDAFVYQNESQLPHLKEFLKDGYVTYVDWHKYNPYTISGTQVSAYQNCIDVYQKECQWQAAIDIDEYPFSPIDQKPGFLWRYLKRYENAHPQVNELNIQNFLFLGKPLNKELMIERVMRRTPQRANVLSKPIYKPANIQHASVHHNSLQRGHSTNAVESELRMNHYWGARLQNWGDDTEESLKLTIPDDSMKPIIKAFKQCETLVRRYLQ